MNARTGTQIDAAAAVVVKVASHQFSRSADFGESSRGAERHGRRGVGANTTVRSHPSDHPSFVTGATSDMFTDGECRASNSFGLSAATSPQTLRRRPSIGSTTAWRLAIGDWVSAKPTPVSLLSAAGVDGRGRHAPSSNHPPAATYLWMFGIGPIRGHDVPQLFRCGDRDAVGHRTCRPTDRAPELASGHAADGIHPS